MTEPLLHQARALGDPTRLAVFEYLGRAPGPVGIGELTAHFGFNHNAIRQHLAKLVEAGLVTRETSAPKGPGRPALRFRPTPGAAERWDAASPYEELATMLVAVARGADPRDVGREAGRRLAAEHGSGSDALEVLEALTRRLGFEPHREEDEGVSIVLDRCPFVAAAEAAPEIVCELHRGLAVGVTESFAGSGGLGVSVTDLVIEPPATAGCRLQLELTEPSRPGR
ncbi:MAG: helix-turn-helix domain-containing protein [Actinomycetota bacterium]|nr:MAG: helix-turn-helix domain-containing protein [Actinomycetota bacterium]